jgi:Ser-tRNA(Ala) deacylase AlaX
MYISFETEKLYLDNPKQYSAEAKVLAIDKLQVGKTSIVTNKTIFYPQGGGQPSDIGTISSDSGVFKVTEVEKGNDGQINHIGEFEEGSFESGELAKLEIDKDRRIENSKLHSAGHLIARLMEKIAPEARPVKGYHWPRGAYVEFKCEDDIKTLEQELQDAIDSFIEKKKQFEVKSLEYAQANEICPFIPKFLPTDEPVRVVIIDGKGMTCGGTHITDIVELEGLKIRKITNKKGNVRISYDFS